VAVWLFLEADTLGSTGAHEDDWDSITNPVAVISVDGHQFSQLCLNTSGERGPSTRDWAQISDDRDGSVLILQLSFPRISHSDHGIPHSMVAVNYIDDNLLDSALGYKVARVLGSSLARSGAEDLGADTPGDLQSTEGLELNYRTPSHF